jgi:hypothetical protein
MVPTNHQLDNAYVSGLSDELNFPGNELVHLQTIYSLGVVLGQLPFALYFPKVRMKYLVPALDSLWGLYITPTTRFRLLGDDGLRLPPRAI